MSLIGIKCPSCGEEGNIHRSYIGKTASCPFCHAEFPIPETHRKAPGALFGPRRESVQIKLGGRSGEASGPKTHTLVYCTACDEISWAEGSAGTPDGCPRCGGGGCTPGGA